MVYVYKSVYNAWNEQCETAEEGVMKIWQARFIEQKNVLKY